MSDNQLVVRQHPNHHGHKHVLPTGIGNVSSVAYLTDVCRATSKSERAPILVGFNIAQQVINCSLDSFLISIPTLSTYM